MKYGLVLALCFGFSLSLIVSAKESLKKSVKKPAKIINQTRLAEPNSTFYNLLKFNPNPEQEPINNVDYDRLQKNKDDYDKYNAWEAATKQRQAQSTAIPAFNFYR